MKFKKVTASCLSSALVLMPQMWCFAIKNDYYTSSFLNSAEFDKKLTRPYEIPEIVDSVAKEIKDFYTYLEKVVYSGKDMKNVHIVPLENISCKRQDRAIFSNDCGGLTPTEQKTLFDDRKILFYELSKKYTVDDQQNPFAHFDNFKDFKTTRLHEWLSNIQKLKSNMEEIWNKTIVNLNDVCFAYYDGGNMVELQILDLSEIRTNAFAIYLHYLVKKVFPNCSPQNLFNNRVVAKRLDAYFGKINWVTEEISNVERGISKGTGFLKEVASMIPVPINFSRLLSIAVKPNASDVALDVYYKTSGFYERAKLKLGKWLARVISTALAVSVPTISFKLFSMLGEELAKYFSGITDMALNELVAKRNKLINNPVKLRELISEIMGKGVVGLKDTIEQLTTLVLGNLALSKSKDLMNRGRCQLISFIGPPGMGKSMLAQRFAMALTGKKIPDWGYYTSASFKSGVEPCDQLFTSTSPLIQNLKRTGGKTVIFIDEIDKFESNKLLECFRDAVDRGTIVATSKSTVNVMGIKTEVVKSETIEVPGLVVIVGTNEKPECWGLEPDPDEPEYQTGRTVVERSESLTQRFHKFKFNPYTADEYKQMYENSFNNILKDSVKMFGLQVEFDKNLAYDLADESVFRRQGARSVAVVLAEMAGAIASCNIEQRNHSYNRKSLKSEGLSKVDVIVKFDSINHKFIIEDLHGEESDDFCESELLENQIELNNLNHKVC